MVRVELDGRACDIDDLVIAGWTGRDVAALEHHIEELKAIGVQPPSKVPLYYRVAASLLTQAEATRRARPSRSWSARPTGYGSRSAPTIPIASSRPTALPSPSRSAAR
jgi:hypothetical protein